jgi:hypothetical protein
MSATSCLTSEGSRISRRGAGIAEKPPSRRLREHRGSACESCELRIALLHRAMKRRYNTWFAVGLSERSHSITHGDSLGRQENRQGSAKAGAQKAPHAREDSPPQEVVFRARLFRVAPSGQRIHRAQGARFGNSREPNVSPARRPEHRRTVGVAADVCPSAGVGYTSNMQVIPTRSARHEFTAVRDENGVPHVEAPSWNEALYAWGYMHALDRPTQLYFARAVASALG